MDCYRSLIAAVLIGLIAVVSCDVLRCPIDSNYECVFGDGETECTKSWRGDWCWTDAEKSHYERCKVCEDSKDASTTTSATPAATTTTTTTEKSEDSKDASTTTSATPAATTEKSEDSKDASTTTSATPAATTTRVTTTTEKSEVYKCSQNADVPCAFPFHYKGKSHNQCIRTSLLGFGDPWCYTNHSSITYVYCEICDESDLTSKVTTAKVDTDTTKDSDATRTDGADDKKLMEKLTTHTMTTVTKLKNIVGIPTVSSTYEGSATTKSSMPLSTLARPSFVIQSGEMPVVTSKSPTMTSSLNSLLETTRGLPDAKTVHSSTKLSEKMTLSTVTDQLIINTGTKTRATHSLHSTSSSTTKRSIYIETDRSQRVTDKSTSEIPSTSLYSTETQSTPTISGKPTELEISSLSTEAQLAVELVSPTSKKDPQTEQLATDETSHESTSSIQHKSSIGTSEIATVSTLANVTPSSTAPSPVESTIVIESVHNTSTLRALSTTSKASFRITDPSVRSTISKTTQLLLARNKFTPDSEKATISTTTTTPKPATTTTSTTKPLTMKLTTTPKNAINVEATTKHKPTESTTTPKNAINVEATTKKKRTESTTTLESTKTVAKTKSTTPMHKPTPSTRKSTPTSARTPRSATTKQPQLFGKNTQTTTTPGKKIDPRGHGPSQQGQDETTQGGFEDSGNDGSAKKPSTIMIVVLTLFIVLGVVGIIIVALFIRRRRKSNNKGVEDGSSGDSLLKRNGNGSSKNVSPDGSQEMQPLTPYAEKDRENSRDDAKISVKA